jgi:uncharacterized transporter YbjL
MVRDFLPGNPVFTLFLVLGCGFLLGRLRIASMSLGPVGAITCVVGMLGIIATVRLLPRLVGEAPSQWRVGPSRRG